MAGAREKGVGAAKWIHRAAAGDTWTPLGLLMGLVLGEPGIIDPVLPISELFFSFILGHPVMFLNFAGELVAPSGDDVDVVVGQFAPLLFGVTSDLFPIAFNAVPVHGYLQWRLKGHRQFRI
jgi:hypothetical protein